MPKLELTNMAPLHLHTRDCRKSTSYSTNNVEYEFWYCYEDIKRCVNGKKKKYMLDWHVVPNTWPVKIGTNISRQEVLALEDVGFHLQQREVLCFCRRLSIIHGGGGHTIVKLNTTCGQKNLLLIICITKKVQNFIGFFSWVDIHDIYYIVKNGNQKWGPMFLIKHSVSN